MPVPPPFSGVPLRVLAPAVDGWRLPRHPADLQRPVDRTSLRAHWTSGVLYGAHDALFLPFLPLLMLSLGGGATQVALLATVQAAGQAFGFLPGGLITRRWPHHKRIAVVAHGIVPRLLLGGLLAAVALHAATPILIMAIAALVSFSMGAGLPAWTALTADLVPVHRRARFIASRNMGMQLTTMGGVLAGGWLIDVDPVWGFVAAYAIALAFGAAAAVALGRVRSRPPITDAPVPTTAVRPGTGFLRLVTGSFAFYLAVWVAAPFFNVHLVNELGANAGIIGALNMISTVGGLLGGLVWGAWSDSRGAARTTRAAMALIVVPPLLWLLAPGPWFAVIPNLLGGFAWAGFNLAWFNHMLEVTPERNRASYVATLHGAVYVAQACGPLLGALIFGVYGFAGVVIVSAAGRAAALLITGSAHQRVSRALQPSFHALRRLPASLASALTS